MGLLDGLIGGAVGAALSGVVGDLIEKNGGVGGIAKKLESGGLGDLVQSWIGKGENKAVSADQLSAALDSDLVKGLAEKVGLSQDELNAKLAEILPDAIDKLTPDGKLPGA